MPRDFSHRLDRTTTLEVAKRHFVARVSEEIFQAVLRAPLPTFKRAFATLLGKRYKSTMSALEEYIEPGFEGTLQALEAFYRAYQMRFPTDVQGLEALHVQIRALLAESDVDLGVRWDQGQFVPSGTTFLDERLLEDVRIDWHEPQDQDVLEPYRRGLTLFLHAEQHPEVLAEVMTAMSVACEAVVKKVANMDLATQHELFLHTVNVSEPYKHVLRAYLTYANAWRHPAHGGKTHAALSIHEVESLLSLTGTFIRLAMTMAEKPAR